MASLLVLRRKLGPLTLRKVACVVAACTIFVNEFFVYTLQTYKWPKIDVRRDPNEEMAVLFVSDPQLIGIQDEMGFPIGPLARWDSDRYLRSTFSRVYAYVQPDVIVFLGDIMDEGSKATASEYASYVSRFKGIFAETAYTKTIILPGDNDIGGEGFDMRTLAKITRFERHFENLTGVVNHNFIDFVKLDLQNRYDRVVETKKIIAGLLPKMKAPLRILINHELILHRMKGTVFPILKMVNTNLLFSGHWHISERMSCATCLSDDANPGNWPVRREGKLKPKNFVLFELSNPFAVQEIMIPTCSYRMGVPNMGYGVALFKKHGSSFRYTVLWQVNRYQMLFSYLIPLALIAVLLFVDFVFSPHRASKSIFATR